MPKRTANVGRLLELFGSGAELARVAQCDRALVTRWRLDLRPIAPEYQARIIRGARTRHLDLEVVAQALGIARCPHCGGVLSPIVEKALAA